MPGTYSLLVVLDRPAEVTVGALGPRSFDAGSYVYTGSAFGPGGFKRVCRHHELAAGERDARHWHLDYLLGAAPSRIDGVWCSTGADRECAIASALPGIAVDGFGASDCDCAAHLHEFATREAAVAALDRLHDRRGLPGS